MPRHAVAAAGSRACGDGHTAYAAAKRATPGTEVLLVLLSADDAEVAAAAGTPGGIAEGARPDLLACLHKRPALQLMLATVAALPDCAVVRPTVSVLLTASVDAVQAAREPAPLLLRTAEGEDARAESAAAVQGRRARAGGAVGDGTRDALLARRRGGGCWRWRWRRRR